MGGIESLVNQIVKVGEPLIELVDEHWQKVLLGLAALLIYIFFLRGGG